MINTQDKPNLRVVPGTNPVAVTRAYAKARMGDATALRWLVEQHHAGNTAATKAIMDIDRLQPKLDSVFVA